MPFSHKQIFFFQNFTFPFKNQLWHSTEVKHSLTLLDDINRASLKNFHVFVMIRLVMWCCSNFCRNLAGLSRLTNQESKTIDFYRFWLSDFDRWPFGPKSITTPARTNVSCVPRLAALAWQYDLLLSYEIMKTADTAEEAMTALTRCSYLSWDWTAKTDERM